MDEIKKPYNLSDEKIEWVNNILSSMTVEENYNNYLLLTATRDVNNLKVVVANQKFGGVRFFKIIQKSPLLVVQIQKQAEMELEKIVNKSFDETYKKELIDDFHNALDK